MHITCNIFNVFEVTSARSIKKIVKILFLVTGCLVAPNYNLICVELETRGNLLFSFYLDYSISLVLSTTFVINNCLLKTPRSYRHVLESNLTYAYFRNDITCVYFRNYITCVYFRNYITYVKFRDCYFVIFWDSLLDPHHSPSPI